MKWSGTPIVCNIFALTVSISPFCLLDVYIRIVSAVRCVMSNCISVCMSMKCSVRSVSVHTCFDTRYCRDRYASLGYQMQGRLL